MCFLSVLWFSTRTWLQQLSRRIFVFVSLTLSLSNSRHQCYTEKAKQKRDIISLEIVNPGVFQYRKLSLCDRECIDSYWNAPINREQYNWAVWLTYRDLCFDTVSVTIFIPSSPRWAVHSPQWSWEEYFDVVVSCLLPIAIIVNYPRSRHTARGGWWKIVLSRRHKNC